MVVSRRSAPASIPTLVEPCLATLVPAAPSGARWLHEIKWDGYRVMAYFASGEVVLRTRRGHDWTARFPTIAKAIARLPVTSAILDGEAVVEDLVLGYYDAGMLTYAGRVGTGFSAAVAQALWKAIQPLRSSAPGFAKKLPAADRKGVIWVRPELVAEIEYRGWTSDGLLRAASFKGLREDKDPAEVRREHAADGR
jgi:bifunctional non-homologous end joining protein LigD